jgi:hypothetical protein
LSGRRWSLPVAVLPLLLAAAVGCQSGTLFNVEPDTAQLRVPHGTLGTAMAVQALQALTIAPEGGLDGYDRACGPGRGCVFGPAWSDDVDVAGGHNGCDTRNDMLTRDLHAGQIGNRKVPKRYREPGHCVVLEGVLDDPYTGKVIHFTKEDAGVVQIDHVVALAAAWRAGAASWDPHRRGNLSNDPRNLLVVDAGINQSKGDATADDWQPPNAAYHCEYARIVVTVKAAYQLTVTGTERATLKAALDQCAQTTTSTPSTPSTPSP